MALLILLAPKLLVNFVTGHPFKMLLSLRWWDPILTDSLTMDIRRWLAHFPLWLLYFICWWHIIVTLGQSSTATWLLNLDGLWICVFFTFIGAEEMSCPHLASISCQTHTVIAWPFYDTICCLYWRSIWRVRYFFWDHSLIHRLCATKLIPTLPICPRRNRLFLIKLTCW